jgi:hypothetical protein
LALLAAFLQSLTEHDAMEIALANESVPSVCRSEDNAAFKSRGLAKTKRVIADWFY